MFTLQEARNLGESINSDGQQFHQYYQNEQPPITSNNWTQKILCHMVLIIRHHLNSSKFEPIKNNPINTQQAKTIYPFHFDSIYTISTHLQFCL